MTFRLGPHSILSAIAAMAFAVVTLALAPSSALAHAGHLHGHARVAVQPLPHDAAASIQAPVVQELTEPGDVGNSPDDRTCEDRGCCGSGSCTGCHGLVLISVPDATPPSLSTLLVIGRVLPRTGPEIGRLRRPPKIFV